VVASSLTILDEKIKATGAKITCDSLPAFYGHRGRMTRLFVSLIDNALKFTGTQIPEIHITGKNNGGALEFCVEDNGIGIEEDYEDIIFVLFQRLHPEGAYPGYGIGLALCKKIVESHGGRMWAESEVGKGSRFKFTLPVLQHS
jgi:signal transduction histidine kinase